MIFLTVGPTATQCGHWKSRNSMMVTGALTGPVSGESLIGTSYRLSSAATVAARRKIRATSTIRRILYLIKRLRSGVKNILLIIQESEQLCGNHTLSI